MSSIFKTFLLAFLSTLKAIMTDKGVLMLTVVAPIIYGAYYPWPYSTQITRNIPVAIVDYANDSLSRKLIRFAEASPTLKIHLVTDENIAQAQLISSDVVAFMVIPKGLRSHVSRGEKVVINMVGHGGYLLPSKNAQKAMGAVIGTVSAAIEIKRLSVKGLGKKQISAIRDPVPLKINPLHNTNQGYGSYVVPAVAWLILQQSLFMGCAMLVGTWFERKKAYAGPLVWGGRIMAISVIHYLVCLGYTGWLFSLWGYSSGGNSLGNLLLIGLFSPCVSTIGCLLGMLIKARERSLQLLVSTALPIFFISGFSWPTQQLPEVFQWIRWVFPSTSAINAGVNLNQLGGNVGENCHYFYALCCITIVGFLLLLKLGRERR